jgi:hypothetical protein
MGYTLYSVQDRDVRAFNCSYKTKSVNELFTQNVEKKIHESMNPLGITIRESCDSDTHPNTIPIQLYLDVTGSMGHIPHHMIKEGLPKLMGSLIQNGVKDASLMFGAIGDHVCDNYPLQIAQFESGDAELDMWLTRTYLEGGGGGNEGESYLLAWYFAANHIRTDAFSKRNKKGFIFTIGDEPCLKDLPSSAIKSIMGDNILEKSNYTIHELLELAQIQNNVYHININHGRRNCDPSWHELLGKNLIEITDYNTLSTVISDIILSYENDNIIDPKKVKEISETIIL